MVDINIRSNIKQFERGIRYYKKQVPFAAAKAINMTLADARQSVIKQAKHAQKSNKAWWASKAHGIRRTFANKKKLRAMLFTSMPWAKLQEHGGIKHPRGKALAVPTAKVPVSRRKASGARIMLEQKKTFMDRNAIYRRLGGKKSRQIEKLFTLTKSARITRPILRFRQTAHKVAKRRFNKHLSDALLRAIQTARRIG